MCIRDRPRVQRYLLDDHRGEAQIRQGGDKAVPHRDHRTRPQCGGGLSDGDPYADIDFLTVKGPEADVNKIDRCVINIDTEDELTESFNTSGTVVLLDKNGDPVKSDQLDMDNQDLISVTIPIYKAKTLPLQVEFVNIPRGFPISELSYTCLLYTSAESLLEQMK